MRDYLGPIIPNDLRPLPEPEGHNRPPQDSPPTLSEKQSEFIFEFLDPQSSKNKLQQSPDDLAKELKTHVEKRTKEYLEHLDYGGSTGIVKLIKKIIHIFTGAPSAKYSTSLSNIELAKKVAAFQADILKKTEHSLHTSSPEECSAYKITDGANKLGWRVDIGKVAKRILEGIFTPAEKTAASIKKKQADHLEKLKQFAANGDWNSIKEPSQEPDSAFDWWMLPNDLERPPLGAGYELTPEVAEILKKDPEFMRNYKEGLSLIAASWGWDLKNQRPITNPHPDQSWTNYQPRLGRMIRSLMLFDERLDSLRIFVAANKIHLKDEFKLPSAWNELSAGKISPTVIKDQQVKDFEKLKEFSRTNKWDQINDPTNTSDSTFYLSMLPSTQPLYSEDRQYRSEYQLTPKSLELLKSDEAFIRNYKEGVRLIAASWGWDLQAGKPIENPHPSQIWRNDNLGLRRMVESLKLFGDKEALRNLAKFAEHQGLGTWQAQINTALSNM